MRRSCHALTSSPRPSPAQMSQDAKLFARGKVEELRAELQADKKDKGFAKRRVTLKKVRPRSSTAGQLP